MKVLVVDSYWKKVYFTNGRGNSIDEQMLYKAAFSFFRLARKIQVDLSFKKEKDLIGAFQYVKGGFQKGWRWTFHKGIW